MGLPDPPSFTKFNQYGSTSNLPGTDPAGAGNLNGNWEIEEALDIEWAHAMAPGASIDLVEASNGNSSANAPLFTAVKTAADLPGVSVVSMSWGLNEYSGEQSMDSDFTTPSGHQGVTFMASSGDFGASRLLTPRPSRPPRLAWSTRPPRQLSRRRATLRVQCRRSYNSETAWSGSGGGTSQSTNRSRPTRKVSSRPAYRTIPDVALDADPNTGVAVYDSYNDTDNSGPWVEVGGTSLAAPSWAGLIAIANQGRVLAGASTLDGPSSDACRPFTAISPSDFNDIPAVAMGSSAPGLVTTK